MHKRDVSSILQRTLAEVLDVPESTITETASMDSIEKWDSLQHLNIILAVEERFGITFNVDEIPRANHFQILKSIIEEKLS